ncbi:ADP-L-glycero-D-manno-heptose-6-epimerase [uncultured archaeon]|nr:ADP-L-glycero-D-manno-heptose-6-epimerase [uncultured archaeon]
MTELVTGGFGFIGSNLVQRLVADGKKVVALDNEFLGTIKNLDGINCTKIKGSAEDAALLKKLVEEHGITRIYHLAGYSSAPMFNNNTRRFMNNLNAFVNVLELAAAKKIKVVYASTSSLYARCKKPYCEDMRIIPGTPYELSKYLMESSAQMYNAYFGVDANGARFFSVYGPHETHKGTYANNVTQFLWDIQNNRQPILYGDGTQTRDFTYVGDIVNALVMIMEKGKGAEVYNIGTGKEYSFNQIVAMLNIELGTDIKPKHIPNPLKNYVQNTLSDISKIKREIGWQPKVSFEEGIKKIVEFYCGKK